MLSSYKTHIKLLTDSYFNVIIVLVIVYDTSRSIVNLQEKVDSLTLSKESFDKIVSIIKKRYPIEACGLLLGKIIKDNAYVLKVDELKNILGSTDSFWIDLGEWMNKILKYKRQGYEYIGIFHSHYRGNVIPSMNDLERMIECPEEIWMIIKYTPEKG